MDEVPPFSEFEIPYDPWVVGGTLLALALLMVVAGIFLRRRRPETTRMLWLLAPAMLIVWGAWEGIVAAWGMDSVAGFFALMLLALLLGIMIGFASSRARRPVDPPPADDATPK